MVIGRYPDGAAVTRQRAVKRFARTLAELPAPLWWPYVQHLLKEAAAAIRAEEPQIPEAELCARVRRLSDDILREVAPRVGRTPDPEWSADTRGNA